MWFNDIIQVYKQSLNDSAHMSYDPSPIEAYVMNHATELGYDIGRSKVESADACRIWHDAKASTRENYDKLQQFRNELVEYKKRLDAFNGSVKDLREHLDSNKDICDSLELDKNGLEGIFTSGSLSRVSGGGGFGFIEPLLPPLRHPEFCFDSSDRRLPDLFFLVHDFASLCRHRLKKHSRTILVDMGAAFWCHEGINCSPLYIPLLYKKFGFHFDHIYAYEIDPKLPNEVYSQIRNDLRAAYHWYNVGVNASIESSKNPLKLLLDNYKEDDFVVIKLDIDTPWIEIPMVQLILDDQRLHKLVDAFYFEHHVFIKQLARPWGGTMKGSLKYSLQLFSSLREKGILAHSWI